MTTSQKNSEFDDDMMEYMYSIKEKIPFMFFFTIDLYSDVVVEKKEISDIISMCDYVLKERRVNDYEESEDIIFAIRELNSLCHNALEQSKKIIVIGD